MELNGFIVFIYLQALTICDNYVDFLPYCFINYSTAVSLSNILTSVKNTSVPVS